MTIHPDHKGRTDAKGIRMTHGMASDKKLKEAPDISHSRPEARADLIVKARSAMGHMDDHNWGNERNRAAEMRQLIQPLERMD
ncbi:hypothetical protein [Kitasatospora sp. NPDC085879]|uniref:hypothetical protein n=1 Tax=Kitasatospora sp. NPDC085879 TaxID=3154769 RepID=UPI003433EFBA